MVRKVRINGGEIMNEYREAKKKMPSLLLREFLTLKGVKDIENVETKLIDGRPKYFNVNINRKMR